MYHTKHFPFKRQQTAHPFFDDAIVRDLFNVGFRSVGYSTPAANIKETKEHFQIELSVPGWQKEDFQISLEKNLLVLSAEKREEQVVEGEKYTRREFKQTSFKRSFELSDLIDTSNISAQYENGILKVSLPKKQEAQVELAKKIEVK